VVEAVGDGVTRVGVGQHVALSWAPSCGRCAECLDDLPHLCGTAWPMMAQGTLLDGTTRLSRGGEPVYHYSFISSFAERTVLPEASCVPIPDDVPAEVARGWWAVRSPPGSAPCGAARRCARGQRAAVIGCGGVGLSAVMGLAAVGAAPIIAVDLHEGRLEAALSLGATDAVQAAATAEETAERVREASAAGSTWRSRPPAAATRCGAAFLSTRRRGNRAC
jgi:Zn-dependent alcohol dehydrogenase